MHVSAKIYIAQLFILNASQILLAYAMRPLYNVCFVQHIELYINYTLTNSLFTFKFIAHSISCLECLKVLSLTILI